MNSVHMIGMFALEHWVVLRNLQDLSKAAIDEAIGANQERQSDQVRVNLHIVLPIQGEFFLTKLPEDRCLQEGLKKGNEP